MQFREYRLNAKVLILLNVALSVLLSAVYLWVSHAEYLVHHVKDWPNCYVQQFVLDINGGLLESCLDPPFPV